MDPNTPWLIPLRDAAGLETDLIGGKAQRLAQLTKAGFRTPEGFCITTEAYRSFLTQNRLAPMIQMELGRKPLDEMRWEEIWDAALRIRSAFSSATVPEEIAYEIAGAIKGFPKQTTWAIRSTAPGEDSSQRSFAGLHESYLGVNGLTAILDAVRLVWASLWSEPLGRAGVV